MRETGNKINSIAQVSLATVIAIIAYLLTNLASSWSWHREWAVSFRRAFAGDQLSYLSIVTESSNGFATNVEPFTRSGSMYYPHMYYSLLGKMSDIFDVSPVASWNFIGIGVQVVFVILMSAYVYSVTRTRWLTVTSFLPIMVGTLSWMQQSDWQTHLESHAVLWGPFATFYVLNGEVAGLILVFAGLLLVVLGVTRVENSLIKTLLLIFTGALIIGFSSSVQTFAFISGTYLLLYGFAFYGLAKHKQKYGYFLTTAALVVVPVAGRFIEAHAGNTAALLAGLIPAARRLCTNG